MKTETMERDARAALGVLIVLQAVMLFALYTKTPPHPPESVAPFGIAPFLGAALALAVAGIVLGPVERVGGAVSGLAALAALVSFGPQKYIDAAFPLIWPAVIVGQVAVVGLALVLWRSWRERSLVGGAGTAGH